LRNLSLTWQRRGKKVMSDRKKVILQDVSAVFPGTSTSHQRRVVLICSWRGVHYSWPIWCWKSEYFGRPKERTDVPVNPTPDPSRPTFEPRPICIVQPPRFPSFSESTCKPGASVEYSIRRTGRRLAPPLSHCSGNTSICRDFATSR